MKKVPEEALLDIMLCWVNRIVMPSSSGSVLGDESITVLPNFGNYLPSDTASKET
jgi:hypothetical protein